MSTISSGRLVIPWSINQTDLLAPTNLEIASPVDGYIDELTTIVQAAVTTGGAVTVKVDTTDVDGLSITVADAAVKGTVQTDKSTVGHPSRKVAKGQRIQICPAAAFNTAGALNGYLSINFLDV